MKIYSFLLLIFLILLISCEGILEEAPKAIAVSTYYNTAEEVETGVNAIYAPLKSWSMFCGLFPIVLEPFSDLVEGNQGFQEDFQTLDGSIISLMDGVWEGFYLSIRNANLVIKNAPNGNNISEDDIAKYVGEAKFMRALSYFYLVRLWGGVPLRTEENMVDSDIPRSSENEVWELIIEDLKYAESNLPDEPDNIGRPSKWVAKTLLADVYFFQGFNSEASKKAKEVIESGKYSLVEVEKWEDFNSKLYGTDVVGSSESIFNIMFSKSNSSLETVYFILLNHPDAGYSGGRGNWIVNVDSNKNPMYNSWDSNDIRKELLYHWDCGFGDYTYLSRKFIDINANGGGSGHDHPVYRYADVLLLYAQASCLASNAPTPEGLEALNQVHRRAYGKKPTLPSDIDFKLTDFDTESFIELALKEQGYESMFECKRWFELKRSGKAKEYIRKNTGYNVSDHILLWPIPDSEIEYNDAIDANADQNPGY